VTEWPGKENILIAEQFSRAQGSILVVDDDSSVRRALRLTLSGFGFTVVEAARGEEALTLAHVTRFDAVLMDVDIPGMGGVEACRCIRNETAELPILMLSVMDSMEVKEQALDAGADDYITKPFRLRELAARLRSAVRRRNCQDLDRSAAIRLGDLELDSTKYSLKKAGRTIHLTPKEFKVLRILMMHAGAPVHRTHLLNSVWGQDFGNQTVYLRGIVDRLRDKIEDDPDRPRYIQTIPQVGYRFNQPQH
jgi:two-component system KDP operon response regulator KdpE